MTAAEKTRLLADRVMGGRLTTAYGGGWFIDDVFLNQVSWQPLTNLTHAGEVLEAMRKKGWWFSCHDLGKQVFFSFDRGACEYEVAADLLPTAICHAALLAHDVKEEEL